MASISNYLKKFLHNYSQLVDFISASLITALCLIVLLPKVHDSFTTIIQNENDLYEVNHSQDSNLITEISAIDVEDISANLTKNDPEISFKVPSVISQDDHDATHGHHHHHNHELPLGEVLICIGFFIFYVIGLGMGKIKSTKQSNEPLMMGGRKISTVCCSSTRCPASQRNNCENAADSAIKSKSHEEMLEGAHLFNDANQEEQCVLLLNRHHNHHTHSKHHNHQTIMSHPDSGVSRRRVDYGSTSRIDNKMNYEIISGLDYSFDDEIQKPSTVYVEEIKITRASSSCDSDDEDGNRNWPISIKITIFGLSLIALLSFLDVDIHGLVETIKVFRAVGTGALLYIAFFLILPRGPAGCNSCSEEEA